MKEAIKAPVIDVKSRGNPITGMQFLKSSNRKHLIGHPRDHAPNIWQIGARTTNHDREVYYRYDYVFCYINPSEIPGGLLRVNVMCSHLKMTWYFTRENNMFFFRSDQITARLWLHNPLNSTYVSLCHRNIIDSSPEIYGYFGNLWQSSKIFGNLTKVFGNLKKTVEKLVISLFIYIKE